MLFLQFSKFHYTLYNLQIKQYNTTVNTYVQDAVHANVGRQENRRHCDLMQVSFIF